MITPEHFTRTNNDINGNPRYISHFLNLLSDKEQNEIKETARPMQYIRDAYNYAIVKTKQFGGKKYRGKDFGGGIVFQSYNLQTLVNKINESLK